MLAVRQKLDIIARSVFQYLQDGKLPDVPRMLLDIVKSRGNLKWGQPTTKLRHARKGYPIGGADGYDIDRTVQEMRTDMQTFLSELVATAETTLGQYDIFQSRKANLDTRLGKLAQTVDYQLSKQGTNGTHLFADTFSDLNKIDITRTNAEFDFDGGFATLPLSLYSTVAVPLRGSILSSESAVGITQRSAFLNAIEEAENTGWFAQLNSQVYACVLTLPTHLAATLLNSIEITPTTVCGITVEYSNDGFNFYQAYSGETGYKIVAHFEPTIITKLRFTITSEGVAGIRSIKLLKTGYEDAVALQSTPHIGVDKASISSATLNTDQVTPYETSIKHFMAPVWLTKDTALNTENTYTGVFQSVSPGVKVWLDQPLDMYVGLTSFTPDPYTSEYLPLYMSPVPAASNAGSAIVPLANSAQLLLGANSNDTLDNQGQMQAEYYNLVRSVGHVPSPDDWVSMPNPAIGYMVPVLPDDGVINPLHTNPEVFYNDVDVQISLMAQAREYSESVTSEGFESTIGSFSKLQIPIFKNSDLQTTGEHIPNMMVQAGGNYKFTTYIYVPDTVTYNDQACYIWNYAGNGNPACAQFSVYLNGVRTAGSPAMISGELLTPEQQARYSASFQFKRGWNKFEILLYVEPMIYSSPTLEVASALIGGVYVETLSYDKPDTYSLVGKQQSTGLITPNWLALYISPNPYEIARTISGAKVRAFANSVARATDFQLRQLVSNNTKTWAWADTTTPAILTNFSVDPPAIFDELTVLDGPNLTLSYRAVPTEGQQVVGCVYKAEISRTKDAIELPKLLSYNIVTDPVE